MSEIGTIYRERRERRDRELILQLNDLYLQWRAADRIDAPLRKKQTERIVELLSRWKELADQLSGKALRRYDVPWAFTRRTRSSCVSPTTVISFSAAKGIAEANR